MKLTKKELVCYMREMMDTGDDKPEVVAELVRIMNSTEGDTKNCEVTADDVAKALDALVAEGMLTRLDGEGDMRKPAHRIYACTLEYLATHHQ